MGGLVGRDSDLKDEGTIVMIVPFFCFRQEDKWSAIAGADNG